MDKLLETGTQRKGAVDSSPEEVTMSGGRFPNLTRILLLHLEHRISNIDTFETKEPPKRLFQGGLLSLSCPGSSTP